jgi:hypothetical protein
LSGMSGHELRDDRVRQRPVRVGVPALTCQRLTE